MHIKSTAAVALLSSLASAGPVLEDRAAKGKFTINQVAVEQQALPPSAQMYRTYQKYMKDAPSKVVVAAKAAIQSGSVVANPQSYDLAYLSQVTVGGQTFNLNFDTGSADLWVYSTLQPSSQTSGRTVYDPAKSKNATSMANQSWKITYGDGSGAAGKVYADTVVIGGVTATSQAVEAATSVSQQFLNDAESGGLVGLSFSNLNTVRPNQQQTFFDSVKGTLASKVFTANLKKAAPGSYDFGFVDTAKYSGAITYAPIQASSGFWQFAMGGYTVGGKAANTASMGNGIADTGTTLLYLPDAVVNDYWGAVSGAYFSNQFGAWIFPCASVLPTFAISITSRNFVIPGNHMNYAPISNTMCFGGLQSNADIGFSILGDVFLKSVFVIFDQTQSSPRIGFAKQAGDDSDNSVSSISDPALAVTSTSDIISLLPTTSTTTSVIPTTTTTSTTTTTTTTTTLATTTSSVKVVSSSLSTSITTASQSNNAAKSTTAAAPKPTTTKKTTTTTTRKVTTTRKAIKKAKTTAKKTTAKKVAAKKLACNAKYVAAIKKKYPKHPIRFCQNYEPKRGAKSIVPGIPTAALTTKTCKCLLAQ